MILIEAGDMLSEEEEQLFETFRDLLCQELQKNQLYQNNRDEYISYLLVDLLNTKYPDEETIRKRLATVDFYAGTSYVRGRYEKTDGRRVRFLRWRWS